MAHNIEHARLEALNTCQVCDIKVKEDELSTVCDHCGFTYHKKCTNLKKSTGHWKQSQWNCQYCQNFDNPINMNDINRPIAQKETDSNDKKIAKLSGKHRKANATSCEHPDKEFLECQINTSLNSMTTCLFLSQKYCKVSLNGINIYFIQSLLDE
jgi:hypothetical protein